MKLRSRIVTGLVLAMLCGAVAAPSSPATTASSKAAELARSLANVGQYDSEQQMALADAIGALGKEGAPAAAALIKMLDAAPVERQMASELQPHRSPTLSAYRALLNIGDAARPALGEALRAAVPRIQVNVLAVLKKMGADKSVADIATACKDKSPEVRIAALGALAGSLDKTAVDACLAGLEDAEASVRAAAVQSFRWFNPPPPDPQSAARTPPATRPDNYTLARVVQALAGRLKDGDEWVRKVAVGILGELGSTNAVEPLIAAIPAFKAEDRPAIAAALGKLGDRRATRAVIKVLEETTADDDNAVCTVLRGLSELGDSTATLSVVPLLKGRGPVVAWNAAWTLGALGDRRAVPALIEALASGEGQVVRAAAKALGQIRDPRAVEPLIAVLRRPAAMENQRGNVASVAWALGQLGDPSAIDPLVEVYFAEGNPGGDAVRGALLEIHHPHVIVAVADELAKERPMYHNDAASMLQELTGWSFRFSRDQFLTWWKENRAFYVAREKEPATKP